MDASKNPPKLIYAAQNISDQEQLAKAFEDIIREELAKDNLKFGRVLAKPVNNLIAFHIDFLDVLNHEKA